MRPRASASPASTAARRPATPAGSNRSRAPSPADTPTRPKARASPRRSSACPSPQRPRRASAGNESMTVDGPDHGEVRALGPRADRGDRRRVGFGLDDHLVHVAMVPTQGRRRPGATVDEVSAGSGPSASASPRGRARPRTRGPGSKPPGSRTSVIDRAASSPPGPSAPLTRRHRCPAAARRTPATPGVRRVAVPTRPNHPCGTTPSPPHMPAPLDPPARRVSAAVSSRSTPPRSPRPHRGCRPARGPRRPCRGHR